MTTLALQPLRPLAALILAFSTLASVGIIHAEPVVEPVVDHGPPDTSFDSGIKILRVVYPTSVIGEQSSPDGHKCLLHTYHGGAGHSNEVAVFVHSPWANDTKIDFKFVYWDGSARWINENLLLLQIWWGRHWGTDYIFNADTGEIVYREGFSEKRG